VQRSALGPRSSRPSRFATVVALLCNPCSSAKMRTHLPRIGWLAVGEGSACQGRIARGGLAAAAVRLGDDLQQVAVKVFEVQAAAAVSVVDLPGLGRAGICPVRQALAADAGKGRVEFVLAGKEGVVLQGLSPRWSRRSPARRRCRPRPRGSARTGSPPATRGSPSGTPPAAAGPGTRRWCGSGARSPQ